MTAAYTIYSPVLVYLRLCIVPTLALIYRPVRGNWGLLHRSFWRKQGSFFIVLALDPHQKIGKAGKNVFGANMPWDTLINSPVLSRREREKKNRVASSIDYSPVLLTRKEFLLKKHSFAFQKFVDSQRTVRLFLLYVSRELVEGVLFGDLNVFLTVNAYTICKGLSATSRK